MEEVKPRAAINHGLHLPPSPFIRSTPSFHLFVQPALRSGSFADPSSCRCRECLGCLDLSPDLPVDRMFLVMVTLSSELRAQSTMPLQPFMGKLMSAAAAGRLWMLRTAAGKEQRGLLGNFYRISFASVTSMHREFCQYDSSCSIFNLTRCQPQQLSLCQGKCSPFSLCFVCILHFNYGDF